MGRNMDESKNRSVDKRQISANRIHKTESNKQNTDSTRQNPQDRIQQTEYNDWARSEGNTETKYTDTNDMTRHR